MHFYKEEINPGKDLVQIVTAYAKLMNKLWTGNNGPVSPVDFRTIITHHTNDFPINKHHDSHEFLLFLLNGFHKELKNNNDDSVIVKWFQVCLINAFHGHIIYEI